MGGLLDLFYFNQINMTRKLFTHKRHDGGGGLEAPRNSLELQVDTSQSYCAAGDLPVYSYQVEEECSVGESYQNEVLMKNLINQEISKRPTTRQNAPNIVARLMGMDMLPSDVNFATQPIGKNSKNTRISTMENCGKGSASQCHSNSNSLRQMDLTSLNYDKDDDIWCNGELDQPRPREHPQEEELQKFKKEFQAWQAARFKECSKIDEHGGVKRELFISDHKRYIPSRSRVLSRDIEQSHVMCSDLIQGTTSDATRIVVLKPGPDRVYSKEECWISSPPVIVEEKGSIKDFLEEVKERLKCELQEKSMETPSSADPRKIARNIANQVRESVSRDLGMTLLRSESTRSHISEIQLNGPPGNARRFWSERRRNVLNKETHMDIPIGGSRVSVLDFEHPRLRQMKDKLKARNEVSYWQIVKDDQQMQTKSFRYGLDDDEEVPDRELSPGNLIRSLSAPVSGTSFGKLLLEDRHVLTGAHIRRKHEDTEQSSEDVQKQKKEKVNSKEKVSHFRYSFALREKLFGRKIHSVQQNPSKDIMSGPTVIMNLNKRNENSTEVPPSPASVCSSAHEEFWRQSDYPTPISTTPDAISGEDSPFPQVFREISSNLSELRKQLNQLESDRCEETLTAKQVPVEPEMTVVGDKTEAYIRDLLVASGLYHGSFDQSSSRWDPFAKPVSNSAFQQVEETCTKDSNESKEHHKMLFDMLNEALSIVLGPVSRLRRKSIALHGRKLLDCVWKMISPYLYPPSDRDRSYYSLGRVVARDLESSPWCGLMDEEINTIGREIECVVIGDLVEDIVKDMQLWDLLS